MSLKPTNSIAWGGAGQTIALPSGNAVMLRPLDVLSILSEEGNVPNFLMSMISGGSGEPTPISAQDLMQAMPLLNRIARATFVMPAIVDEAAAGRGEGISVHQVSLNDKLAVMMWCMGGEQALSAVKSFLAQQGTGVPAVQAG